MNCITMMFLHCFDEMDRDKWLALKALLSPSKKIKIANKYPSIYSKKIKSHTDSVVKQIERKLRPARV